MLRIPNILKNMYWLVFCRLYEVEYVNNRWVNGNPTLARVSYLRVHMFERVELKARIIADEMERTDPDWKMGAVVQRIRRV